MNGEKPLQNMMMDYSIHKVTGARCPPRPIPCPQPPPPRTPSPPPPPSPPRSRPIPTADSSRARDIWIPVSDGSYASANGDTGLVRSNFTGSISITWDKEGRRVVKEEPKEEPALPPFTSLLRSGSGRITPPRPPPPRWVSPHPQRPAMPVPQSPPPPYQGIIVSETSVDPPPYGEVAVEQLPIGVRVTSRTSSGLHPEPSAPMLPPYSDDDGYGGSLASGASGASRGTLRPHSESPFLRNVRARVKQECEVDMEAVSCLLDFSMRNGGTKQEEVATVRTFSTVPPASTPKTPEMVTVRTFSTSTPKTPAAAPRPERPPQIVGRRVLSMDIPQPRALRPGTVRRPPSA